MAAKHPTKAEVQNAVDWLDQGGEAARAFKLSLEAGGVMVEDLMRVVAAVDGLLTCGLERTTLMVLIQNKAKKHRNGDPLALSTIEIVLDALEALTWCRRRPRPFRRWKRSWKL